MESMDGEIHSVSVSVSGLFGILGLIWRGRGGEEGRLDVTFPAFKI